MTKRNLLTLLIITAVTVLSVIIILPTVGVNELEITLNDNVTADQVGALKKRFSGSHYSVKVEDKTVNVTGLNINDAVTNEILKKEDYPFVKEAKILPHWAESAVWAKRISLGLDLQGGSSLVLQADYEKLEKELGRKLSDTDKTEYLNQALELLPDRINPYGVSEPMIRTRGNDSIELQMPGVRDPEAVKKIVGMTGRVEYRLVDEDLTKKCDEFFVKEKLDIPADQNAVPAFLAKITEGMKLPSDKIAAMEWLPNKDTKKLFPSKVLILEGKVSLAGNDIASAKSGLDQYGRLEVEFKTTAEGAQKFADATAAKNHGRRLAIVIDEKVRSAPSINVQIRDGSASITGDFTEEEVNMLVRIIKEGSLPVSLRVVEERTVGPTLGQDAIHAGLKAGAVALIAITIFMIAYYKFAGVISIIGLVLNALYALAMLSWAGFTLTLPGLAGFVLTLGMAIDANVIIYERIREELRLGRNVSTAIHLGFDRAFWTIFDSNLTTVLAALILCMAGSGPIKGYAVTLTIGIIANMFVALYVTKFYYMLKASKKDLKKLSI
jgi:preprotein translocase subunit SecD